MTTPNDFETARASIRQAIEAAWSETELAWDGFNGGEYRRSPLVPYCRPTMASLVVSQRGLSPPTWSYEGDLAIQVFVPLDGGETLGPYLCARWEALFRGRTIDGMTLSHGAINPRGSDGVHYEFLCSFRLRWNRVDGVSHVSMTRRFQQAAHGFAPMQLVLCAGTWEAAQAIDDDSLATGIVLATPTANDFVVAFGGVCRFVNHGFAPGATLYLSQAVAGEATALPPVSGLQQVVGVAVDADHIVLTPRPGVQL